MLNQLDNLTERVRGSNKLVDRWLHVRFFARLNANQIVVSHEQMLTYM